MAAALITSCLFDASELAVSLYVVEVFREQTSCSRKLSRHSDALGAVPYRTEQNDAGYLQHDAPTNISYLNPLGLCESPEVVSLRSIV